ncbi:MAG TPA: hypothetical protein ENG60_00645 [Thermoplasmatales archaeon]|nr:hypothetical protein [Thermoplasmatales archaeon]HEX16913.1 hypothetical protein [Thermoplasmatales archaeon]
MIDREEMERFPGEWILIHGDKLIDHSPDLGEILKSAEDFPADEVTIAKIPSALHDFRWMVEEEGGDR